MNNNDWSKYIYDLHEHMKQQENLIQTLMSRVNQLEDSLQAAKSNKIEKVEYHFDQLKIEHLDGTLHIGLSPQDLANLEDTGFPNQPDIPNYQPPLKQTLQSELGNYLHETGPSIIRQLAREHSVNLNDGYPSVLIQDIEKQLPGRIAFHENEATQNGNLKSREELHAYISDNIKSEIQKSLAHFMHTKKNKGESS
ncbi:MAG: spore germination protein GerPC [Bacillota bacterium]|uniref:Spore germination protein PC n=1 Tax=Virgibacillus salarius TaxID=447199 RepID=A0A941IB49_9BACI|nr:MULTISPECIES: spore germination protein GerPC [Bacillaceae]NAZ10068.1 hypothetical protein [Agaribacter marinus]MBR7797358.1 hypothetical protein [Virgibacillus salarius]MCC2250824.1 spore germination protein GerPC [Virgibacillus sp. AGTR]MDY7046316.1 spore germination protein GerPC [Virgibacillus sp. M23]QRZ16501.1 hypothetical protein JUJ52_11785 [Virgibacillus sp. AGTR]